MGSNNEMENPETNELPLMSEVGKFVFTFQILYMHPLLILYTFVLCAE